MTFTTRSLSVLALATGLAATGASAQEATFGMVDGDGDGYLTETELTTAFGEVGLTLLRYDLDGDGRLTPQEIAARNEARAEGEAQGSDSPSANVDRVLEKAGIRDGDGNDNDEDEIEEDEFGETDRPGGDVIENEDDGADEFGNFEENEAEEVDGESDGN